MSRIGEVLAHMVAVPGVRTVVAVGRDGLLIEAAGQGDTLAQETLGALGASALGTGEALGREIASSPVVSATIEYDARNVTLFPLGRYAAIVALVDAATDATQLRQAYASIQGELVRALDAQ